MTNESETYNGWKNRETWLANLWLENEYRVYKSALETAKTYAASKLGADLLGGKLINALVLWRNDNEALANDLSKHDLRTKVSAHELGEHWIDTAEDHLRHKA